MLGFHLVFERVVELVSEGNCRCLLCGTLRTGFHLSILVLFEQISELGDLVFVLLQEGILWVFVNSRLVLYIFRTTRVTKRGKCLVEIVVCGGKCCNHHGLCVASKRVLQQTCQFRGTVGDMLGLAIDQRADYIAQSRQRQINLIGFFEPVTRSMRLALPFGASQIDQVHFTDFEGGLTLDNLRGLNVDGENGVRSGRVLVHRRFTHFPVFAASIQKLLQVRYRLADDLSQVLDVDTSIGILLNLKRFVLFLVNIFLLLRLVAKLG